MAQPRLIKYLENGEYKYASVKYLGDVEKLKTTAKSDLVSAINELFENGGAVKLPPDIEERLIELEVGKTEQDSKNTELDNKILEQEAKQSQQEETIQSVKKEYELSKEDITLLQKVQEKSNTDIATALQKAGELESQTDQIIIDLQGKVSTSDYQTQYEQVKKDLSEKVDVSKHASDYDTLITGLDDKVNAIDYQSTVDSLSSSIEDTQDDIVYIEEKVDNIQIGGRNLLRQLDYTSETMYQAVTATDETMYGQPVYKGYKKITSNAPINLITFTIKAGETYTATIFAKQDVMGEGIDTNIKFFDVTANRTLKSSFIESFGSWHRMQISYKNEGTQDLLVGLYFYIPTAIGESAYFACPMLEKGNVATDFTLAPEYIDENFYSINQSVSSIEQKTDSIQSIVTSMNTTVDEQGARLSDAETTIGQHATSINLKANATDVYKKNEIDTSLGGKVDTTTYDNKMSEIDISITGINQTVSSQATQFDNLTGVVTGHTSQISSIDQKADGIAVRVTEAEKDMTGLTGRIDIAETNITANTKAIELKASQNSLDTLSGRVSTAEGRIEVQAGQISQTVTKTEFDSAVGVNEWIASKYVVTGTDLTTTIPTFPLIRGLQSSEVKNVVDSITPSLFTGDNIVTHLFTNVYLKEAKTVSLSVKYDDSIGVYVNGAMVYENKYNSMTNVTVSMSLRAGWNTIEILHGLKTGTPLLNLGTKISTQVDKMTTVIGVGDKNETRLSQAESAIIQNEKSILLKANATDVTALGNRVSTTEGSISVLNDAITSKVEQTTFDAYSKRVSDAESTIIQLSDSITQSVSKTEYDKLNDRVETAEASIATHTTEIELKVSKSDFDGLKGRVSNTETQILANTEAIELKASQKSLDSVSGRLSTAEGQLTVATDQIATKVSQTDFDTLEGNIEGMEKRISSSETAITQTTGEIALRATKEELGQSIESAKKYVQSRTENLVTNGTGLLGDNTNFTSFDFDRKQVFAGGGSFFTNKQGSTLFNDELIPIDASQKYRYSLMAKSLTGLGKNYFGLTSYDVDGNIINPYAYYGSQYPITTLAKDLKLGDTEIHLTSSEGFMDNFTTPNHTHSIVFWGYKNSFGYEYPAGTYSRDYFSIGWNKGAVNRTTHVITLNKPFNLFNTNDKEGAFRAGHKVSPTSSGGIYQYTTANNVNVPKEWTKYEGTINGNGISDNTFPYGTAFVKLVSLVNRSNAGGQAGDSLWVSGLEFSNITQEENAKGHTESAVSQAKAEIKITTDGITQSVNGLQSTVDEYGRTIASYDTSISQMNEKIDLKAEKTVVEEIFESAKNAESKAVNANELASTANSNASTANTVANNANDAVNDLKDTTIPALTTRISDAESSISVQAEQILSKVSVTEVNQAIEGIKIGGSNLILSSNTPYSTSGYLVNSYELSEDFIPDEEYTFVVKGTVAEGQMFRVFMNNGNSNRGNVTNVFGKDTTYVTFKAVEPVEGAERKLSLYNYPNNTTSSTVEWVALYKGNKPMDWSPAPEDINTSIIDLSARMQSAEQAISEDSIIATVTSSQSFADVFDMKADAQDVADNYVSNDQLTSEMVKMDEATLQKIRNEVENIDIETFAQFSELKQTTSDISANFTSAGGVNLLKNSVGFAGFDFWTKTGSLEIRQNEGLDVLGYGSGFYAEKGKSGTVSQIVPVVPNRNYTLTVVVDKSIDNTSNGQAGVEIYDGETKIAFIGKASGAGITVGYETFTYSFNAKSTTAKIVLTVGANASATITGAMLNVGSQPLQWTMAHGEIYNTNVRFDMKGIKVSKIEDDKETKFTVMTPDKFAGYYDVNGDGVIDSNDGSPDEVFKMDEDSFVMKKAVMKEEVSMGTVKIINIETSNNKGWAFIADI